MALVAGFGLFCATVIFLLMATALNLHAKIVLASSIFYMSPQERDIIKQKSNGERTKFELESRKWFPAPNLCQWLWRSCFWKKKFPLIVESSEKLDKRLDIRRFLHEQKMTRLAFRGLLTKGQYLFVRKAGKMLVRDNLQRSDSDSSASEKEAKTAEETFMDYNYIEVMQRRKSDLDQRLFRVAVEMNLLEKQSEVSSWFVPAAVGKMRIRQQEKILQGKKNYYGKDLTP